MAPPFNRQSTMLHQAVLSLVGMQVRAEWRGVKQRESTGLRGISIRDALATRTCTNSAWPRIAARCKGVWPVSVVALKSGLHCSEWLVSTVTSLGARMEVCTACLLTSSITSCRTSTYREHRREESSVCVGLGDSVIVE